MGKINLSEHRKGKRFSGFKKNIGYARLGAERDADLQWLCWLHHEEAHKFGRVRWATYRQRNILINQGFDADMVYEMTFGQAFDLIARLCSGECVPPAGQ